MLSVVCFIDLLAAYGPKHRDKIGAIQHEEEQLNDAQAIIYVELGHDVRVVLLDVVVQARVFLHSLPGVLFEPLPNDLHDPGDIEQLLTFVETDHLDQEQQLELVIRLKVQEVVERYQSQDVQQERSLNVPHNNLLQVSIRYGFTIRLEFRDELEPHIDGED